MNIDQKVLREIWRKSQTQASHGRSHQTGGFWHQLPWWWWWRWWWWWWIWWYYEADDDHGGDGDDNDPSLTWPLLSERWFFIPKSNIFPLNNLGSDWWFFLLPNHNQIYFPNLVNLVIRAFFINTPPWSKLARKRILKARFQSLCNWSFFLSKEIKLFFTCSDSCSECRIWLDFFNHPSSSIPSYPSPPISSSSSSYQNVDPLYMWNI